MLNFINKHELINCVSFAGQLNLEDLRDLYYYCDVVVLPSYDEGLGRVLLEAQAMGKPVIAYDVGGINAALINGKTGYMVKKGNAEELFLKIKDLLINERIRLEMGREGRKFIEKFYSLSKLTERHEEFYIKAINKM